MSIYTPYTYFIGWSKLNKFYYGRRTAKNCHPNEFWVRYFTSSKEVEKYRKENGEPDIIQIRKFFPNNPDACKLWESKFLEKVNAQHNPKFLNKKNGDNNWDTTDMISVRDIYGNTLSVSRNDPRYLSGELKGITTGFFNAKDKNGNIFRIPKNDPRYLNGELVHISKGLKYGKQSEEHIAKRITKESTLKSAIKRTGLKQSEETKQKRAEKFAKEWLITDPDGNIFKIKNLNKFCRENGLCSVDMGRVAMGKFSSYNGWKCAYANPTNILDKTF